MGPPPAETGIGFRCFASKAGKSRDLVLVLGMWNVISLVVKEPEMVWGVERYQLDIVGLTSTHKTGSRTKFLKRGWTSVGIVSG